MLTSKEKDIEREYPFYNFSQNPIDTSVHVSYEKPSDPEELSEFEKRLVEIEKERIKRMKERMSKGSQTQHQRYIERKNKLAKLLRTEKEVTLEQASIYLEVSQTTVKKYLREMNMMDKIKKPE